MAVDAISKARTTITDQRQCQTFGPVTSRRRAYVNQRLKTKQIPIEQARKPEKRWSISNALRPIDIARKRRRIPLKCQHHTDISQFFADNGENKSVRFRRILSFVPSYLNLVPTVHRDQTPSAIALTDNNRWIFHGFQNAVTRRIRYSSAKGSATQPLKCPYR